MDMFDFFKKKSRSDSSQNRNIEINLNIESPPEDPKIAKARELKRQATEVKKEDINKSIQLMQQAIELEDGEEVITDSIRLAKYLYKAGRKDEAWKLYNDLIIKASNIKDKSEQFLRLMDVYQAMGLQLEKEKKYKTALRNYLMAGFLQKKADLEFLLKYKNQLLEQKSFGAISEGDFKDDIEKEQKNHYEHVQFLLDKYQHIKRNKFPEEKEICKKILDEYGGWENFLNNLNQISLRDFTNKISEIIGGRK